MTGGPTRGADAAPPAVEFVMNCFERNIRQVTAPGFLDRAIGGQHHSFALRTLLINNVADREDAASRAGAAIARGEIDRYRFVDEHLDRALGRTGLRRRDFGRYLHWSDSCVVALDLDGPEWLCYVDVDLQLRGTGDWIARSLELMAQDRRLGVANPLWRMSDGTSTAAEEADEAGPDWNKGYGFTDQIFLCRKRTFLRPLLSRAAPLALLSPASLRWPAYQMPFGASSLFFEQIVDAFMRRTRLLRLTVTGSEFQHIPMSAYPISGWGERIVARLNREWLGFITAWRRRSPGLIRSPRLRTTGLLDPEYRR